MMRKSTPYVALLALGVIVGIQVAAQVRNCDLQITINSPANNAVLQPKDTAWLEFTIKNNGPDAILAADTIFYWDLARVYSIRASADIPAKGSQVYTKSSIGLMLINNGSSTTDNSGQYCLKIVNQNTVSYGNVGRPLETFEDADTANNWSCVTVMLKGAPATNVASLENELMPKVNFYPNPSRGVVNFDYNLSDRESIVAIVRDISGREVLTHHFVSRNAPTSFSINTTGLQEGIYFVELISDGRKSVGRIVVQGH